MTGASEARADFLNHRNNVELHRGSHEQRQQRYTAVFLFRKPSLHIIKKTTSPTVKTKNKTKQKQKTKAILQREVSVSSFNLNTRG